MNPGLTELNLIFPLNSAAKHFVKPSTADFVDPYPDSSSKPNAPTIEDILTTEALYFFFQHISQTFESD